MEGRERSLDDSDGWVEEALQNDFMVANLLMRLSGRAGLTKQWLRRLPRSRQQQLPQNDPSVKDVHESAQASPTTPLSWTDASSPSACDDSSRPAPKPDFVKSKVGGSKSDFRLKIKTRKRKTSNELKEEVHLLLIDNETLIKEIESHKATLEDLVRENKKLKKLKLDLEAHAHPPVRAEPSTVPLLQALIPDLNLPASGMEFDA